MGEIGNADITSRFIQVPAHLNQADRQKSHALRSAYRIPRADEFSLRILGLGIMHYSLSYGLLFRNDLKIKKTR